MIWYPHVTGYAAYGIWSISLLLFFIPIPIFANTLLRLFSKATLSTLRPLSSGWLNRRKSFRVIYPSELRPRLIIDATDAGFRRRLEFSVIDLSQDGIRFLDDGSLGQAQNISGKIRLISQQADSLISGSVIRLNGKHVCVNFTYPLPWKLLLAEQRHLLLPPQ